MTPHNGIIELGTIENTGDNADQIGLLKANFVHYPDCQQLTVWLPEYGRNGYGNYRILDKNKQNVLENTLVDDKLSGSIQMLFDTLTLPESEYTLEIDHPKGGKHVLHFQKFEEDFVPEKSKPIEPETNETDSMWKVYTDGFGNPIPNEDQVLREKAKTGIGEVFKNIMSNLTRTPFEIAPNLKLDTEIINQALTFATEWGENFQKPIYERMAKKYPELSFETVEILQVYVKKAESYIYDLAYKGCPESEIGTKARREYPWLSDAHISRLTGIGMYYAMK